jgi:transcription-repair coupling factor (superfamily II helicase)
MNRLLIGDVGYGKTEVALRAVAAAVLAGRQVVLAAPTTILARQHFETMRDRLAAIDAEVAELSRLTPEAERDEVLARIASGEARVVVGTHSLLAEDVAFRDLGLTIIDEEQKFGREQKVGLRALCPDCHVLSMTATPIPRSLAAAEIGLVDVSVLATAPGSRRPVETRLLPPSPDALRGAVAAEVARGGQCYVVCPRIEGLERIEEMLDAEECDHVVAHGQMPEDDLEERLLRFTEGKVDVLLSTSIVESGLDNPRANTMVVFDAELYGLTQLHQLRGRVGRGGVQARMLLLSEVDLEGEPDAEDDAARRLIAFTEATEIGCGFRIARKDRDMRGFGALDGDEQSGHVSRLGLGLYRHILRGHRLRGQDQEPTMDTAA